jgi:hypothetical protein
MIINDISHPNALAIKGTVKGASRAPICAPELKTVVANALSFFGKYSAMAFIDAGKFPASPIARTKRAKINSVTLNETIAPTSPTVAIMFFASEKLPVH